MNIGILNIIEIIGSLAFFIYGMKVMSDGIQLAAGGQLRSFLRSLTKNRFIGLLTGTLTTAAVQSSSATTVMTVSLVNAGLLNLRQSAGLMMGANIGTTITAWIIAGIGFRLSIYQIILPILAIGVPLALRRNGKARYYGEFIVGFAILFMGLNFLTNAVPDIGTNQKLLEWFRQYTDTGFTSRLLFILIGALITILIQSSSAAMALTLTVCMKGWLPLELGAAMVLGENFGTTITAELAALVGNSKAKQSARIHSLFNLIGIFWMVIMIPFFIEWISNLLVYTGLKNPIYNSAETPIALAAFHTMFNVLNAALLIGFVPLLIKAAIFTAPARTTKKAHKKKLIRTISLTPELAITEIKHKTIHFTEVVSRIVGFTKQLINSVKEPEKNQLIERIIKYESISDNMEAEILVHIRNLSRNELSQKTSSALSGILSICHDLERIGDIFMQIAKDLDQKYQSKIWFSPDQRNALNELVDLIDQAYKTTLINLNTIEEKSHNDSTYKENEEKINKKYAELRNVYMGDLDLGEINIPGSLIFYNILTLLETVGNHIHSINESISKEL